MKTEELSVEKLEELVAADAGTIGLMLAARHMAGAGARGVYMARDIKDVIRAIRSRPQSSPASGTVDFDSLIEEAVIGGTDDFPAINRALLLGELHSALTSPVREVTEAMVEAAAKAMLHVNEASVGLRFTELNREMARAALSAVLPNPPGRGDAP